MGNELKSSAWSGDDRIAAREGVVVCDLEEGKALLNLEESQYFKLNDSAGKAWSLLQDGIEVDALVDAMSEYFEVDRERVGLDVISILDALLASRLIQKVD